MSTCKPERHFSEREGSEHSRCRGNSREGVTDAGTLSGTAWILSPGVSF